MALPKYRTKIRHKDDDYHAKESRYERPHGGPAKRLKRQLPPDGWEEEDVKPWWRRGDGHTTG